MNIVVGLPKVHALNEKYKNSYYLKFMNLQFSVWQMWKMTDSQEDEKPNSYTVFKCHLNAEKIGKDDIGIICYMPRKHC